MHTPPQYKLYGFAKFSQDSDVVTCNITHASLRSVNVWGDDIITKRKLQQWTQVSYEKSIERYGRHGHLAVEKKECSAWIYVQYVCHILRIRDVLSTSLVYRSSIHRWYFFFCETLEIPSSTSICLFRNCFKDGFCSRPRSLWCSYKFFSLIPDLIPSIANSQTAFQSPDREYSEAYTDSKPILNHVPHSCITGRHVERYMYSVGHQTVTLGLFIDRISSVSFSFVFQKMNCPDLTSLFLLDCQCQLKFLNFRAFFNCRNLYILTRKTQV